MNEPGESQAGSGPDPEAANHPPTLGEAAVLIAAAPGHLFERLAKFPVWPLALAVVGGPMLLLSALTFPSYRRLSEQFNEIAVSGMEQGAFNQPAPETLVNALFVTLATLLLGWLIGAALLKFTAWIYGDSTRFAAFYSVVAFASFPLIFRYLLIATSWSLQPLEITSHQEFLEITQVPFPWANLGFVAEVGTPLWNVLVQIDPFSIWMVGLAALGVRHVTGMDRARSFLSSAFAALLMAGLLFMVSSMLPPLPGN